MQFANCTTIKPKRNRRVSVFKLKDETSLGIQLKNADLDGSSLEEKPTVRTTLVKGRYVQTTLKISNEAAIALMCCLQDYFERLD